MSVKEIAQYVVMVPVQICQVVLNAIVRKVGLGPYVAKISMNVLRMDFVSMEHVLIYKVLITVHAMLGFKAVTVQRT